ncbi:hypothetical protein ACFWUP_24200 [Nocardia sp. NPDC058658]|uniref:hypothetical protein n=1 Tax=Nocardia sp. NPDC058658 TaxID=3346580 RepID=UPI00365916A9
MAGERPMQGLIDAAKEGQLSVSFSDDLYVNVEEFVYIERDCQAMKDQIQEYQGIAESIANREVWGLGDLSDWLKSGPILVGRFRAKAKGDGGGNDVHSTLQKHWDIIDGIQQLHREIASRYQQSDSEFAAKYTELMNTVPHGFQGRK